MGARGFFRLPNKAVYAVLLVAVGVAFAGCGSSAPSARSSSPTATPAAITPVPSPTLSEADELSNYITQTRLILVKDVNAENRLTSHWNRAAMQGSYPWRQLQKATRKAMRSADNLTDAAAALVPPKSLRIAHAKFVRACRAWYLVFAWEDCFVEVGKHWYASDPTLRSVYLGLWNRFDTPLESWWSAVRKEARRLGVSCPRSIRGLIKPLPGVPGMKV